MCLIKEMCDDSAGIIRGIKGAGTKDFLKNIFIKEVKMKIKVQTGKK
jgi:hypothetical protein